MNNSSATAASADHLLTPGTWLAMVPRDQTIKIVEFLNLASAGLGYVRDRILIGVDADDQQPSPGHPRADTIADTAHLALDDLVQLRGLVASTIRAVAAAAISGGADPETVMKWAREDEST
ncbi:hypothetical protein F0Q45_10360 [Mycobacterium simiae]|uniref:Uncharacterized protein n=1 Tax=Mycobacterium simiae TaxID=1784 RepID=A0A5B1BQM3_MYCSI|nr:hypothetical protein [Mycobacterium simiae]KAA1250332.1 hypothetical protein F0Q45_10360 [Mycobacterium simiae]